MPNRQTGDKLSCYQRLDAHLVTNSNVTSSYFLGSAPRPWMARGEQNGPRQAQSSRRCSNPASERPKPPKRIVTDPHKQALGADSAVEVGTHGNTVTTSSGPGTETR